jgi:predicted nucleic-acid-binding protein
MNKLIVDTHILLRIFVNDGSEQNNATFRVLEKVDKGTLILIIPNEVVIEAVWVMESYYKLDRTVISSSIQRLMESDGIEYNIHMYEAIMNYKGTKCDIVDLYLSSLSRMKHTVILTWDKDFKKLGCEYFTPDQI